MLADVFFVLKWESFLCFPSLKTSDCMMQYEVFNCQESTIPTTVSVVSVHPSPAITAVISTVRISVITYMTASKTLFVSPTR